MASLTLYPPIIESSMPAFIAKKDAVCRVYFSLSQFNTHVHFKNVQVSVVKQDSGLSVVNRSDGSRYRATGIILNVPVHTTDKENLFYIEILNEDIGYQNIQGWTAGWLYKIQLRLSNLTYEEGEVGQAAWLNNNTQYFSEWSTTCLVKAIGNINIKIPVLDYDSGAKKDNVEMTSLMVSTLDIFGTYSCEDKSELLHSFKIELYEDGELVESSGTQYTNQYVNTNEFKYLCKYDLKEQSDLPYTLKLYYKTVNDYEAVETIDFTVLEGIIGPTQVMLRIYGEHEDDRDVEAITSIALEEDEGRIGIRFKDTSEKRFSGNLCIRRTDEHSDFKIWHDIAVIVVVDQVVNNLPIYYDYTAESGVIYQYGVQTIDKNGSRGTLNKTSKTIIRSFEYNYLLGENGQQLKLMFNSNMNTFKPVRSDVKTDTIGNAFPFITRNGSTKYKTFPVTGLISFNMDEQATFISKDFFQGRIDDIYTKERIFRDTVLEFLTNGKPKLFKSPTEGNVIIRLVDVTCSPEQALGRLIYNFSATAYEIAEPTMENYLHYGFYILNPYKTDFSTTSYKIGQLQGVFAVTDNICQLIKDKYASGVIIGDQIKTVTKIIGLKITIEGKPLRIKNNTGEIVLGNNFKLNDKIITIYGNTRRYQFDEEVFLTVDDSLFLLGDADNTITEIEATIDFICEITVKSGLTNKEINSSRLVKKIGQLFKTLRPNEKIIQSNLFYKYYIEWTQQFRRLNRIISLEIEAIPGAVFLIQDAVDNPNESHLHEMNSTGILRFSELNNITEITYMGIRVNGEIQSVPADVIVNYNCYIRQGTYK